MIAEAGCAVRESIPLLQDDLPVAGNEHGPREAVRDETLVDGEAGREPRPNGIVFDSVRYRGGVNAVAYRPSHVRDVVQADHYAIDVSRDERRMEVELLRSG